MFSNITPSIASRGPRKGKPNQPKSAKNDKPKSKQELPATKQEGKAKTQNQSQKGNGGYIQANKQYINAIGLAALTPAELSAYMTDDARTSVLGNIGVRNANMVKSTAMNILMLLGLGNACPKPMTFKLTPAGATAQMAPLWQGLQDPYKANKLNVMNTVTTAAAASSAMSAAGSSAVMEYIVSPTGGNVPGINCTQLPPPTCFGATVRTGQVYWMSFELNKGDPAASFSWAPETAPDVVSASDLLNPLIVLNSICHVTEKPTSKQFAMLVSSIPVCALFKAAIQGDINAFKDIVTMIRSKFLLSVPNGPVVNRKPTTDGMTFLLSYCCAAHALGVSALGSAGLTAVSFT